jgi:hypothetical protein
MITSVNRDIPNENFLWLPSSAYTGGLDFNHSWKDRMYYIGLNVDFSHIKGDKEAITNLQQSSARYYQRPDADHLTLNEELTTLNGSAAALKFGKRGSNRWSYETSVIYRSPGFEINDIGFMRNTDAIHHGTWVGYYIRQPFWIFENFRLNNNYWMTWNFDGELLTFGQNINFNTKFKNKWHFNYSMTHNGDRYQVSALRGGPALIEPGRMSYNVNINSDNRKKLRFYYGFWLNRGQNNYTSSNNHWGGFTYRPINALSVSLSGFLNFYNKELQYIGEEAMNGDARYLFGSIEQKTIGLTIRLNYNVTPDLTIQYYGSPFVSAGDYTAFKLVDQPQAAVYEDRFTEFSAGQVSYNATDEVYSVDENLNGNTDYSFSQPDYNFAQFRSNMVVRWEYLPGSTVYFVWSQGRSNYSTNGEFDFADNLDQLFDVKPRNIFLVKFSYRFSL